MNIWLTSSEGFLGKELSMRLQLHAKNSRSNFFTTNRQQVNLIDSTQVDLFIEKNEIDLVVHNAIKGGRRTKKDDALIVYENILMYENIAKNHEKLFRIINFDSAASFDRRRNIDNCNESEIGKNVPIDYYGFSKMNIALRSLQIENSYNLRIFNCFGPAETPDRMTKSNIINYIKNQDIVVFKNKYMDIFYIDDLYSILEYYLIEDNCPQDVNCVYNTKTTLLDVAEIVNNLSHKKSTIKVLQDGLDLSYTGNSTTLNSLNLKFKGLQYGIEFMYQQLVQAV
jgi:nucleoside-diphosphate-sugar epimerase